MTNPTVQPTAAEREAARKVLDDVLSLQNLKAHRETLALPIAHLLAKTRQRVQGETLERAAQVADDSAHGNAFAAGSIGLGGGGTRAHTIMSQRADEARQIAAHIRALAQEAPCPK